jgi:hypothetical protein
LPHSLNGEGIEMVFIKRLIPWFVQVGCDLVIKIDDVAISQPIIDVATFSAVAD